MNLSLLALRNLGRNKRRTLITASTIGFGLWLSVTFTGTSDYMYTNMINSGARMGQGHITLQASGYNAAPSLEKRLTGVETQQKQLVATPGVEAAIPRIYGQAIFASASKTVGGIFLAIDPAEESPRFNLFLDAIIEGSPFATSSGRSVIVGSEMARKLNLKIGKKLVYTATNSHGEIVSDVARVVAIFRTGATEVDGGVVLLPLNQLRQLLDYRPDEATMIAIMVEDQRQASQLRDQLGHSIEMAGQEILSWHETLPDLAGLIAMDRSGNLVSQFLVGLLVAAGILNTLLMSVLERRREFGIMVAIGMPPVTLFRLVVVESFWLALLGIVLGTLLVVPWYAWLLNVGLDFTGYVGTDYSAGGVLVDPIIRIRLFPERGAEIVAGVILLTLLSGLYPAWRAGRVMPVESLQTV